MNQIDSYIEMLHTENINFEVINQIDFNTPQVYIYNSNNDLICDIVCNPISYGYKDGLLELLDAKTNEVYGWLTAVQTLEKTKELIKKGGM